MSTQVPQTDSIQRLAEFWDTHDLTDFENELEEVNEPVFESMKADALKRRLDRNRPMTTMTLRIPEDVVKDLERISPLLGFSDYQLLARAYIGQGLRADLERLEGDTVLALLESLKRHGVSEGVIQEALSEVTQIR